MIVIGKVPPQGPRTSAPIRTDWSISWPLRHSAENRLWIGSEHQDRSGACHRPSIVAPKPETSSASISAKHDLAVVH